MAPLVEEATTTVFSTQVLSHDESSVLVEAGAFTPMRWFLDHSKSPLPQDDYRSDDLDDEPPAKKRKTDIERKPKTRPIAPPNPARHIPISRVSIYLHFSNSLGAEHVDEREIEQDVEYDDEDSVGVTPSIISHFDEGLRLRLASPHETGPVVMVDIPDLPPNILDAFRRNAVSKLNPVENLHLKKQGPAATIGWCTLTRSRSEQYTGVRLQATLYWRSGISAFPHGIPLGKARVYPDYDLLATTFPDGSRDEVDHTQPWTPQDFYDSLHVPDKNVETAKDFIDTLDTDLFPFQKRALHWMLEREGRVYESSQATRVKERNFRFEQAFEDVDGVTCYVNHLQGTILRKETDTVTAQLSGGILAEEMGLGKTVELLALISTHRRNEPMSNTVFDFDFNDRLIPSKATLIVTPTTILDQWRSELRKHAPALKILDYVGVPNRKQSGAVPLDDLASKYDVILTTYAVLTREVYFAEDPPERDLRHKKRFKPLRSPLVQIQWWRVCLDEAQMVESGVSAAARVACRLPRVHSWAVSGTPLRKNVQDLHGLLVFLRYKPLSEDSKLWSHLIHNHKHLFRQIFSRIALRHTKVQIREELQLPTQKRVVITVPFTAIEQQHYSALFAEMCEEVGVNNDGSPLHPEWDPNSPATVEAMRTFLLRLRQTCLHPQVGGRNRRALGRNAPLRTVAEVLEVMIDQKETGVRVEERALLAAKLMLAHIFGNDQSNMHRSETALDMYLQGLETSKRFVRDARERLAIARNADGEKNEELLDTTDDEEDSSSESTLVLGKWRNNLRTTLQLQHNCAFFAGTAYYQIKANEDITAPDSEEFKNLEGKEMELYEEAKQLRKEILKDSFRKAEKFINKIKDMTKSKDGMTLMPNIKTLVSKGGFENRRIVDKSDQLFDTIREQGKVIVEWRVKMAEYLLKPLVDEDEGIETTGDEYEDSTKLQDELYAYFDAVKAVIADLNTFVTGEDATLIDYEMKTLGKAAKTLLDEEIVVDMKGIVHAPELTLELLAVRTKLRDRKKDIGSVRGLIQEARTLETSLQMHTAGPRAIERELVHGHLQALQTVFRDYTKALVALEKEIDLFRQAQNQRLEFYRQLQELSDGVKPYKEDLDERLDNEALAITTVHEKRHSTNLADLQTSLRYLVSLRDQNRERMCVICRMSFETGVITTCGHEYCKECIQHWWSAHRTCPVCKRVLASADFHNITYKPRELRAQEEVQSDPSSPSTNTSSSSSPTSKQISIYSNVDSTLLSEIKSIDLPTSYGTKIDTLGRHLHWIREHDPGAKSIVFSQYREFLDVLSTALTDFKIGHARLGRAAAALRFKQDPSIDCLLLDAKTDSSGLTLVNATHVFICEPLIQTAVELQAIARVHRIGQTRPTTVWMYLIGDTVEEAIYEISVARRLAHVQSRQAREKVSEKTNKFSEKKKGKQPSRSGTATPALQENAIDAANSEELQAAALAKLLINGKGGGEIVRNEDLWRCLFGKVNKDAGAAAGVGSGGSGEMEVVVGRHLRAEAAEERRVASLAGVITDG